MIKELEEKINNVNSSLEIKLNGNLDINYQCGVNFFIGKTFTKGIINIARPNVVIDGAGAEIKVSVEDAINGDWSLFFIKASATNVQLKNLNIRIFLKNQVDCNRIFSAIYNTAVGLKIQNCHIEVYAEKQSSIIGVFNNGNLDTTLETRADNMVIENSYIKVECHPEEYSKEVRTVGIYNYLANSISVQNTFVYATMKGCGENQQAIGIYTNGRYGRFVGNNIKANGTHNKGRLKEQAHVYGFINEGSYSLLSANNIVGEWAGESIGFQNQAPFVEVSGNKILATHTICGRSIRNYSGNVIFTNNIITSTSRNARLLENWGGSCIISKNFMEVLMPEEEVYSGCGIYAIGDDVRDNLITENIIRFVLNCGIFIRKGAGIIQNNIIESFTRTAKIETSDNAVIKDALDAKHIFSIYQ